MAGRPGGSRRRPRKQDVTGTRECSTLTMLSRRGSDDRLLGIPDPDRTRCAEGTVPRRSERAGRQSDRPVQGPVQGRGTREFRPQGRADPARGPFARVPAVRSGQEVRRQALHRGHAGTGRGALSVVVQHGPGSRQRDPGHALADRRAGAPRSPGILFDPPNFLAISTSTPVVRYLDVPKPVRPLEVGLPIRILGVVSAPSDFELLDADAEKARLTSALKPLLDANAVSIEWLDVATLPALTKKLQPDTFHILHFIGHGGFDRTSGRAPSCSRTIRGEVGRSAASSWRRS